MIKHTHTKTSQINFSKLEERILSINAPLLNKSNDIREMLYQLTIDNKSTLIVATGGSKVFAYYLQLIIERLGIYGIICEVIEPGDLCIRKLHPIITDYKYIPTKILSEALKELDPIIFKQPKIIKNTKKEKPKSKVIKLIPRHNNNK